MSNQIIRAELESRLKAWAAAQMPPIPVAWQGAPFNKPVEGVWLEALLLPNDTLNIDLSGKRKTYMGLFQINCWSKSGKGMGVVEALAQNVINLFPMLPKIGLVSIEQTPSAEKPISDTSGWVIVPVTIRYRMEAI